MCVCVCECVCGGGGDDGGVTIIPQKNPVACPFCYTPYITEKGDYKGH